jgi:hypothetical protein
MPESNFQTYQDIIDKLGPNTPGSLYNTNPTQPLNTNFLTNNKFKFIISRCPTVTYFCQRANIPSLSFGVSTQAQPGGISIRRPGTAYQYEDLQVGFIVNEDMTNWLEIYEWIKKLGISYDSTVEVIDDMQMVATGLLLITDSKYKPSIAIRYMNMFPTFLGGIDLDSALPDTDPIVSTATFSYTHYEIEILQNP